MSSIPLAALAVQPPPDPTQGLQRAITLRNLLQNQPLELQQRQQAVQSGQLQLQQQRMELQSQQAIQKAYTEAQGDPDKTVQLGAKYGALPQHLMALKQSFVKQQMDAADLVAKKGANAKTEADILQGAHDAVDQAKPEDKPQVYQQQLQGLKERGMDTSQLPPQYPGDDQFKLIGASVKGHSQLVEDALKQAEQNKNASQAHEADVSAKLKQQELEQGGTGPLADSRYRNILMKPAAQRTSEDNAFVKAYEKQKTLVPTAQINLQGGLLSPQAQQMAADYYAQTGQLPAGMRSPAMSAKILNQAAGTPGTQSPNIAANKRTYAVGTALEKAYTSGSQGQQLTAINTAREHMKTFKDTADALENGKFLVANRIGNWLGTQFGSDKATNFNVARTAFAGEVGKAFAGASVGVADRQELIDKINQASSWDQLKGYADTADKLLEGKQRSLKESYQQGMQGNPNFGQQPNANAPSGAFSWDSMPQHK